MPPVLSVLSLLPLLALLCAGIAAGALNAVGGGGTFVALPALVAAGLSPVTANASTTVALLPGALASAWTYRREIIPVGGTSTRSLAVASVLGGGLGAGLLLALPPVSFAAAVPWLLAFATVVLAFGRRLAGAVGAALHRPLGLDSRAVLIAQFVLAIYGGYFGAAVGIMLLAAWSLLGRNDIHGMNAAKTVLVGSMNCVATVCFIVAGKVWWPQTLIMMGAAVAGGYLGARLARRLDPRWIRAFVITVCFAITAVFFARR